MTAYSELADLKGVFANRAWLHRATPFPHVTATDVFTETCYAELAAAMRELLDRGLSDMPVEGRFARGMRGYDAYGLGITERLGAPLDLFISPAWRDMLADLFAVSRTPYLFAGAHHHPPGGETGFIHDDFNPVWFPRASDDGGIQLPDPARCDFKTGVGSLRADKKVETIRGAVAIYYLLNDGWQPGDGGETGLFHARDADPSKPVAAWPPRNNSLIAFECTPRSFHAFLANRRPRTSVIMWVHRPVAEAVERYGVAAIERWQL